MELATFGAESGIPLDADTTLEIMGHMLGFWVVSADERDLDELRTSTQDLFQLTLAVFALIRLDRGAARSTLRLRARLRFWVEAREVEARANVLGSVRELGDVAEIDGPLASDFAIAAQAAWALLGCPSLRVAFKDYGISLQERGDDAFLYSYRAIENTRRFFAPDIERTTKSGKATTATVWGPMHAALRTSEAMLEPLTSAATAIRHGNAQSPQLARARGDRERTLSVADQALRALLDHQGITW